MKKSRRLMVIEEEIMYETREYSLKKKLLAGKEKEALSNMERENDGGQNVWLEKRNRWSSAKVKRWE